MQAKFTNVTAFLRGKAGLYLAVLLAGILWSACPVIYAGEEGPSGAASEAGAPAEGAGPDEKEEGFTVEQRIPSYAVVVDKNTTVEDYFPAPSVITGYDRSGCPLDRDGHPLMYTWCYEEGDTGVFLYYDDEGSVIRKRDTDPVYLGKNGGMGRLYIYLTYPDAGVYRYYYQDTYFWVVMTNDVTGYTYAILLDYGLEKAEILMPAGLYYNVYVTSSDNMTLPAGIYCPDSTYVYASGYGHLDIVVPPGEDVVIDRRTERVDLIGNGISPTNAPVVPDETVPDIFAPSGGGDAGVTAAPGATAGGLLSGLEDNEASGKAGADDLAAMMKSLVTVVIILTVLLLCLAAAFVIRGIRKKDREGNSGSGKGEDSEDHH